MDSAAQDAFRVMARGYVAQGGALVLTSHHWDEIEAICSSIAVIDRGETVLAGRIDAIRARARITRLGFDLPPDLVPPLWLGARHDGARWQAETADSDTALRRMVAEVLPFANLTLQPLELKDLIHHLRQEGTRP